MKIKTAELIGPALDWAVALAIATSIEKEAVGITDWVHRSIPSWLVKNPVKPNDELPAIGGSPSTDWAQGGPIIEREKIGVWWDGNWHAKYDGCLHEEVQDADAPLIAAMRCIVTSKLGNEVEIPEELV